MNRGVCQYWGPAYGEAIKWGDSIAFSEKIGKNKWIRIILLCKKLLSCINYFELLILIGQKKNTLLSGNAGDEKNLYPGGRDFL